MSLRRCLVKTVINQNGESQNGDTRTATTPNGDSIRGIYQNGDREILYTGSPCDALALGLQTIPSMGVVTVT